MSYWTFRDGQNLPIITPYEQFKEFKKTANAIMSDGFSSVFQAMEPESTIISKMRFEFDEAAGFNVVDGNVIARLVFIHQEVIGQITGRTNPSDLICFVMTHPQMQVNGVYVEEVYFQFPNIKGQVMAMYEKILPNLKHFLRETAIHEQMELIPINDIESMLSGDIYRLGLWPLPGSYISGNLLTLSYVFDKITQEQLREERITAYPPEAYFNTLQIPDGLDYDVSNSFFFTNLKGFEIIKKKKTQREKNRDVTSRLIEERQRETKRNPKELCKMFVDMLAPERFANDNNRNRLGQVLFNVLKGSDDGLDLWKEAIQYKLEALNNSFPDLETMAAQLGITVDQVINVRENSTQPQPPLKISDSDLIRTVTTIQNACDDFWQYIEYTQTTIGTLKYWAKLDNPQQYTAFLQKDIMTLAWKCLNATSGHTDVAKLVYAKYSDQVCCANIKDGIWFSNYQHRWHELDKCHDLVVKISDELPLIFEKILNECSAAYKAAVGDEDKEKWITLMNSCARLIKDLKMMPYISHIINACAYKFHDPDFVSKLDEDRTLLGCPNGVYELETGTFRLGKPEDFISLNTKAKYNPVYTFEHPRVQECIKYMKTVYPDIKLRHYIQKCFGTILEGGNMNKDFYNMIGEGDNSKSMVAKLLKLALGKYISKIPVAMIMGKRGNADNATPHLADKKGVRALFVEEPPKGQSNVSVVKELSGNDDVLSRALFKMPIIFSPQWKLFVFTNHMLEAPAEEKAYWNRQKVIDHESTFTFDAPATEEEQFAKKIFPRDPFFDRKLINMAEPFLWLLTKWYEFFKREGLTPPEKVLHATNLAKLRNDIYLQYIQACLVQGTQHDISTVDQLYEDFRGWYQTAYIGRALPLKREFEDEMSKGGHLSHKPIDGKWFGIKYKNTITQLPAAGAQGPNSNPRANQEQTMSEMARNQTVGQQAQSQYQQNHQTPAPTNEALLQQMFSQTTVPAPSTPMMNNGSAPLAQFNPALLASMLPPQIGMSAH